MLFPLILIHSKNKKQKKKQKQTKTKKMEKIFYSNLGIFSVIKYFTVCLMI